MPSAASSTYPRSRFVSYPAASRDGDASLLLGWAGWDHREQAQALATLISQRRGDDGWAGDSIQPLLAGLAEVLSWVHQWHADIDPVFGAEPGDIYDGFLDSASCNSPADNSPTGAPDGRVNVAPLPTVRRPRTTPDPAHLEAVLDAAAHGLLSNEQIRELTGLDAPAPAPSPNTWSPKAAGAPPAS